MPRPRCRCDRYRCRRWRKPVADGSGSTRMEKMSESSIRPLEMECQVAPPSVVFHGKCGVPAYRTLVSAGSNASAVISCISGSVAREDSAPGGAAIHGNKNAFGCSRGQRAGIDRRHRQRFDARSAKPGQGLPGFAAVFALVDAGVLRIAGVQTGVVMRRLLRIDQDRIEYTRGSARKRQQTPGCACIVGTKQQRVTRTSNQRAAVLRINRDCSRAPAERTCQLPPANHRKRGNQKHCETEGWLPPQLS